MMSRHGDGGRAEFPRPPRTLSRRSGAIIRVAIADEDRLIRQAIRRRLARTTDLRVVAEVTYGGLVVPLLRHRDVDVVVMDLQPTIEEGLAAVRALTCPDGPFRVPVVVLTGRTSTSNARAATDGGALGYLLKSRDTELLPTAVRAAARGESVVTAGVPPSRSAAIDTFTPLERAIVARLSAGRLGNEELAADLRLSVNAIRGQLTSCLRKTGLTDRTQLARWAARNGIEQDDEPHPG